MLTVWVRLCQYSVGSNLGLCFQRLTADNKILRWQAKTIMKNRSLGLVKRKNDWKRLILKESAKPNLKIKINTIKNIKNQSNQNRQLNYKQKSLFVRYFPIMEDTQIKTQTPKMSIHDPYFFCAQSLMATLNLLATNVTYVIITDVITQVTS